jgi:thiol-disulfide isomerase/thioredoxin
MKNSLSKRSLLAGAAITAGLAGAGLAQWQTRLTKPADTALDDLWNLKLDLPQGGTFAFSSLRGKPALLNFWATWCPPCVEELPLLNAFYKQHAAKSWQVIGVAVDNAKAVNQFIRKMPLDFPTPLAGLAGIELTRTLGNVSGGLPFTVVLNSAGGIAVRQMGKLTAAQLEGFLAIR